MFSGHVREADKILITQGSRNTGRVYGAADDGIHQPGRAKQCTIYNTTQTISQV